MESVNNKLQQKIDQLEFLLEIDEESKKELKLEIFNTKKEFDLLKSKYEKEVDDKFKLVGDYYQLRDDVLSLINDVYVFAGRPTKDGAKLLRESAAKLEELLTRN